MQQQDDLRVAFSGRLEQCPKCEYQAYVEGADRLESLFNCQNPQCRQVSCRSCREPQHGELSCSQAKAQMTFEHAVEEALSERMVRVCSKCHNRTIKEVDATVRYCNKMTCPRCQTVSCFICSATPVTYDHFSSRGYGDRNTSGKCALWGLPPIDPKVIEEAALKKLNTRSRFSGRELDHAVKQIRAEIRKHI